MQPCNQEVCYLLHSLLHFLSLLCFALLCFALLCFALLCFALLCFALLSLFFISSHSFSLLSLLFIPLSPHIISMSLSLSLSLSFFLLLILYPLRSFLSFLFSPFFAFHSSVSTHNLHVSLTLTIILSLAHTLTLRSSLSFYNLTNRTARQ